MSDAIWPIDTKFLLGPDEGVSWVRLDFALDRIARLEAELAERDRMLQLSIEDSLPNFSWDDMEDCSLMASRLADLRARAEKP